MKKRYSKNLDSLLALISFLATTKNKSNTPSYLAKRLSIDEERLTYALENFEGIFRRSSNVADNNEHYYTLHLRYGLRWKEEAKEQEDANNELSDKNGDDHKLPPEYLTTLIDFVAVMVAQENEIRSQSISDKLSLMTSAVAAIAAIIAAVIVSVS